MREAHMASALSNRLRDGITAMHARDFERARTLLERAAVETPENATVWFWLAMASDSASAALPRLRRALQLDRSHAQAKAALLKLLVAGAATLVQHDRAQARMFLVEAVEIAPNALTAWINLAALADAPHDSLEPLRRAHTLAPHREELRARLHEALVNAAVECAKAHKPTEAKIYFREAADLNSEDTRVWEALARLAATPDEAIDAWAHVVRLDPSNHQAATSLERLRAEKTQAAAPVVAVVPPSPRPAPPPKRPAPPAPVAKRTVMVVDDSPTIRKILGLTLERAGYAVVAEADGESAVTRLADLVPDLILLDITMPKLDGYEVCKRIKKDARLAHVPVVMLSGKDGFFDKVKGRMVGATEYLTKPFQAPAVLAVIAKHCQTSEEVAHG